jgi:hypothetical protein
VKSGTGALFDREAIGCGPRDGPAAYGRLRGATFFRVDVRLTVYPSMPTGEDARTGTTAEARDRGAWTRRAALRLLGAAGAVDLPATDASPGRAASARQTTRGEWTQAQKLVADDGDPGDAFGISVAIDGPTAVIGARGDEAAAGDDAGSAYVFERGDYSWIQAAKLVADDGDPGDAFGYSVAVDGSTAVVGAFRDEDPNGDEAGSAYVFQRDDYSWAQSRKLVADDGNSGDRFGYSVAVDGSTAVVGAPEDEDPNGDDAGLAYVFQRQGGSWTQTRKLAPDDGDSGDRFGDSVAVSGSTAVVGAGDDQNPNGERAGSAYVFQRRDGSWTQTRKLAAADGDSEDGFGASVTTDESTVVVGAPDDEGPNNSSLGSVYVFERRGDSWTQAQKLTPNEGGRVDEFGYSVAVEGPRVVVSALGDGLPIGNLPGAAYVFERREDAWRQVQTLTVPGGDGEDGFGFSVALGGSTALVGAFGDEEPNGPSAGSTHVFEATATGTDGEPRTETSTSTGSGDGQTDGGNTDGSGAGPGIASAVAGIAGAGYLLKRRVSSSDDG